MRFALREVGMEILVNGQSKHVDDGLTAAALVDELGLAGRRVAVEINQQIVPKSSLGDYRLNPNDCVEIVHAIGGG